MTKKLLLGICLIVIIGFGIKSCYQSYYEYIPVLEFENNTEILFENSITVEPFIFLDVNRIFTRIKFEGVKSQITINSIEQNIVSIMNPNNRLELSHVLTYTDTINWERENDYLIRASTYDGLPNEYKQISPIRQENVFKFIFKRPETLDDEKYLLKIKIIYTIDGKKKIFKKNIDVLQSMQWKEIRMMT